MFTLNVQLPKCGGQRKFDVSDTVIDPKDKETLPSNYVIEEVSDEEDSEEKY